MTSSKTITTHITILASGAALALSAVTGCATPSTEDGEGATEQHVSATERGFTPIAGSARLELGMVTLRDEVIISEVAIPSADDIKPGFEVELFAPTTLRPIAGLHGADGLSLGAREMAIVSFAPISSVARRPGGRQDAALYLDSAIDAHELYTLPTEYRAPVVYTGHPGIAVTEAVCDFSTLSSEDAVPYPGIVSVGQLADGEVHGAVTTMDASGEVKIRLVAQVERCAGPITNAAQAKAEPRLCYEKLVWLRANGGKSTELGRLSAYRAPLTDAQRTYCGD
ncbi:MAG: hypothetical protein U0270_01655 [Labilithrix sp.]